MWHINFTPWLTEMQMYVPTYKNNASSTTLNGYQLEMAQMLPNAKQTVKHWASVKANELPATQAEPHKTMPRERNQADASTLCSKSDQIHGLRCQSSRDFWERWAEWQAEGNVAPEVSITFYPWSQRVGPSGSMDSEDTWELYTYDCFCLCTFIRV
jgi:hypothetical protein